MVLAFRGSSRASSCIADFYIFYGLFLAGMFLTAITGNLGLIASYLLAGLAGSIASAYVHPATVSVGASGAIFGLFGMLLVHLLLGDKKLAEVRKTLLPGAAVFVALNLLVGLASPGIDNAAHIGGLVSGVFSWLCLPLASGRHRP
ncbi:MAG: hypothetical protein C5B58_02320 [Acidobacteria bacterium]|nr:MAG: hypothetical protein C5B58_02320 [Acidobacteriota bacterium]